MEINLYNSISSKIGFNEEATYLPPYLIMADKVMYNSIVSEAVLIYKNIDQLPEIFIIALSMGMNGNDPEKLERAKSLLEMLPLIKKIRNTKHKDKIMLNTLGCFKQIIGYFRIIIKELYTERLTHFQLIKIVPFADTNIWDLDTNSPELNPKVESKLITGIAENIISGDTFLSLNSKVEKSFHFDYLNDKNIEKCDFIKIPLWTFPPITVLNYEQMMYTREQLKTVFKPFKKELQILRQKLRKISFANENLKEIRKMCSESLLHFRVPVQKEIHESMYLSSLRNNYPEHFGVEFCLGIASIETVVEYYEKHLIIEPYMAGELKNRISKHIDTKSSYIFTYFDLHGATPDPQ